MTSTPPLAELEDLQAVFVEAGYRCQIRSLGRFSRTLLAENPYALVAAVETEAWAELVELVSDLQAELTRLAIDGERVAIRWDLYVLIHVRTPHLQQIQSELLDQIESNTKYARKFVRVNLTRDRAVIDRALRPFLPLRPAAAMSVADPIELVRVELLRQGLDADLVEHSLATFHATGEVTIS